MGRIFAKIYRRLYISHLTVFLITFVLVLLVVSRVNSVRLRREFQDYHQFQASMIETQYREACAQFLLQKTMSESCRDYIDNLQRNLPRLRPAIYGVNGELFYIHSSDPKASSHVRRFLAGREHDFRAFSMFFVPIHSNGKITQVLVLDRYFPTRPSRRPSIVLPLVMSGILIALLIVPFTLRLSKPIREMLNVAGEWAEGRLHKRVVVKTEDDVGELQTVLNQMAENLGNLLDQRKEFLAFISHELKSPLTRIKLAVDVLRQDPRQEIMQSMLLELDRNIEESESLIEQLLLLSRLEMSLPAERTTPVDLRAVLSDAIRKAEPVATATGCRLEFIDSSQGKEIVVCGNTALLERAIANVLTNSIKYAPPKSAIVMRLSPKESKAVLEIEDSGPGVARDELTKIFEAFYRGRPPAAESGTGLGLFITKRVVENSDGKIFARNNVPTGLIVSMELPLYKGGQTSDESGSGN